MRVISFESELLAARRLGTKLTKGFKAGFVSAAIGELVKKKNKNKRGIRIVIFQCTHLTGRPKFVRIQEYVFELWRKKKKAASVRQRI